MTGALSPNERPYLRLVHPRPAPRIEIRVSVAGGRTPIGRSRLFRIHPQDVDDLLAAAKLLEARG